jgi:hypothetical protein
MAASLGQTSLADVHHEGLDQVSKEFPYPDISGHY